MPVPVPMPAPVAEIRPLVPPAVVEVRPVPVVVEVRPVPVAAFAAVPIVPEADSLVLLLGGRDKDLPWDELMQLVNERVDASVPKGIVRRRKIDQVRVVSDDGTSYVLYPAIPNGEDVRLARAAAPSR